MSNSNRHYRHRRGNNHRRKYHRIKTFDPSHLVKKTVTNPVKKREYAIQHQFSDFGFNHKLLQNVLGCGFNQPTPVQDQAITPILQGKDVVGLANTGTGKTAAFLIPLINNLIQDQSNKVLIMAPTRELAIQIEKEFKVFSKGLNLYSTLCIGGTSINRQISELRRQPHFVIGTPGRLIDLTKRRKLNLNQFKVVVLDEVDRMLDMGFINDMKFVIQKLPRTKQTLFFSATLPKSLDTIVKQFTRQAIKIEVQTQKAAANVDQDIVKINGRSKLQILHDLLKKDEFEKVLVFGRTKHGLNKLSDKLNQRGFRVETIHGNKSQNQRQRALQKFRQNRVQVLLATDVASRGLDIDDVTHVINYDLPESYEVYIHRIGRTGRANKTGTALSFVD